MDASTRMKVRAIKFSASDLRSGQAMAKRLGMSFSALVRFLLKNGLNSDADFMIIAPKKRSA